MNINLLLHGSLEDFRDLLTNAEPVVNILGGRRYKRRGFEGDISLNSMIEELYNRMTAKSKLKILTSDEKNEITEFRNNIQELHEKGNRELSSKNLVTKILTFVRSFFANLFFNRTEKLNRLVLLETPSENIDVSSTAANSIRGVSSGQKNRIHAWRQAIADVINSCNGLTCWLEGGSLLGAFRNHDIIPWDHSAYISFMQNEFDQVQERLSTLVEQKPNDYKLENWSKDGEKTFLRLRLLKTNKYVDLYFYEHDLDKNQLRWIDPHPDTQPFKQWQPPFDANLVLPLTTVNFNGHELPAPAQMRNYLLLRYGDLRPTHHYDAKVQQYVPTTGDQFIREQQKVVKENIPVISEDTEVVFEGEYANIPIGIVPPETKNRHKQWAEVIAQMNDLLEAVKMDYWIDAGTLLGAYRHGEIIPWDHDADISIMQKDFNKIWDLFHSSDEELRKNFGISRQDYPILNSNKFRLQNWSKDIEVEGKQISMKNYLRLQLVDLDDYLDIYTYQIEPDSKTVAWNEPYPKDMAYLKWHKSIPQDMIFPLKKAKFCGKDVKVPNRTREYMEIRYGNLAPSKVWSDQHKKYVNAEDHEYNTSVHAAV